MCAQVQFQEPRTKLWLFDTLVTSVILYGVQIWGPSINTPGKPANLQEGWKMVEKPLITMIAKMIRAKQSVPHEIIRAEMAAPPIVVEALARTVSFLHNTWNLPENRYTKMALESSRKLAAEGDKSCWYAQTTEWLESHGLKTDRLPPFQYSLDAPSLELTKQEINQLIRQDLIQNDTKRTWIEPVQKLGTKMAFYQEQFLHLSEDGFIVRPSYMNSHLSFSVRCAIGQIRTSSHQLEKETGRYSNTPPDQRICRVCQYEPETEEHHICRCTAYYEIRGRFHCLFKEGFGPLSRVMDYNDQRCLGLFLLEIKRHRENFLRKEGKIRPENTQRQITGFFQKFGPVQKEELKRVPSKGVRITRAMSLGKLRRPKKQGLSDHRKKMYKFIKKVLNRYEERASRTFGEVELDKILKQPMKGILR